MYISTVKIGDVFVIRFDGRTTGTIKVKEGSHGGKALSFNFPSNIEIEKRSIDRKIDNGDNSD